MEAKHQLNDLHQQILKLAATVKSLENELQQNEQKKSKANDDLKKAKQRHDEDKDKIGDEKDEARKFLAQLRNEMAELRKIAQPDTKMNITADTVDTSGGHFSLLQISKPDSAEVNDAQAMMIETKLASTALLSCLQTQTAAPPENTERVMLLDVRENVEAREEKAAVKTVAGVLDSENCSINQSVLVTVGNVTKTVLASAAISNDTYRSYHCGHVDSKYGGTIWLHCLNGVLTADPSGCIMFTNDAQCKAQRQNLEDTYVKAYVGIARLIDQWAKKVADKTDENGAQRRFDDIADPANKDASDASAEIADKTTKLQDLRTKLQDAWNAEKKLQDHITATADTCSTLGSSTQYLADVRTAILALEACPGLQRAEFRIPKYMGDWAYFMLDNNTDDATNDATMNAACVAKWPGSRAAEISEIEGHSIEGAPETNTATLALVGTCPNCAGAKNDESETHTATGHARICWFPDTPTKKVYFNLENRTDTCYKNRKAVMCVSDRGDVRKLAGFATMPPTTPTPSSS